MCEGALVSGEVTRVCAGVETHAVSWRFGPVRAGAAPVVLVHGFSQSALTWRGVGPRLARALPGATVWAPEFVGHGRSSHACRPEPYAFASLVRTLETFLEEVALGGRGGRAGLLGYSMGGRVTAALACERPDLLAWLALESAGLGPADATARAEAAERDARLAARLRTEPLSDFMDFWEALPVFTSQLRLPCARRRELRAARMANDPACLALTVEGSGQHVMPRLCERLARTDVPVLYLAGALDAKYVSVARSFGAEAPCARVRVAAGVGHDVHFEDEDAFCAEVIAFASAWARKDVHA